MSEVRPVVKVAQDLREMESLYAALLVQAIHKARAKVDGTSLPGGDAMVALGAVGSPEEWSEQIAAAEFRHLASCPRLDHTRCRYAEHAADEDGAEPPLQTLLFWSEQWRAEHGYPIEGRPTMTSEVRFLRWALEWAWETLPEWSDFTKDIKDAKARLENLLLAGERAERGAPCLYETCKGARLVRKLTTKRGPDGEKIWDFTDWHCPKCKRSWDEARYASMVTAANEAAKFEDIDGETWCSTDYAARHVDRPESTIRVWVHRSQEPESRRDVDYPIATACLIAGRRVRFVRLADVVARHEASLRRKRAA